MDYLDFCQDLFVDEWTIWLDELCLSLDKVSEWTLAA